MKTPKKENQKFKKQFKKPENQYQYYQHGPQKYYQQQGQQREQQRESQYQRQQYQYEQERKNYQSRQSNSQQQQQQQRQSKSKSKSYFTKDELERLSILGLSPDQPLTLDSLKKAYLKQVKKYHPDIYQGIFSIF